MDIVYDLPFSLTINGASVNSFSHNESDLMEPGFPSFQIQENDDISLVFDSQDKTARLYLEALDIIPNTQDIHYDDGGDLYIGTSSNEFILYKNGDDYDALRVDCFRLLVICAGEKYYGLLEVIPKHLSSDEWTMMRDDLEDEIAGLAQDIVRRSIGLGEKPKGVIPPEKVFKFFVINKYSKSLLNALIELQDSPKYRIVTEYEEKDESLASRIDSVTVKNYQKGGGKDLSYLVPKKVISYDIQENRLLKHMINEYDRELNEFIELLNEVKATRKHFDNKQYRYLYNQGIESYLENAEKLRRITSVIKYKEWYQEVGTLQSGVAPHSFVLDSRYGIIYKMFSELRHQRFDIKLDKYYSYAWKKSSTLYEMWCFVKVCRALAEYYSPLTDFRELFDADTMLFPYLDNGKSMLFENDTVRLSVVFDQFVPKRSSESSLYDAPFYCVGKNNRPDITINIYRKDNGWYIGSIILECKYRKLSSFWQVNNNWSSKPQIQAYYTENMSEFTYGEWGKKLDIRPIQAVIVLTPDKMGDNTSEQDIRTLIKTLRPDNDDQYIESVLQTLELNIEDRIERSGYLASETF